MLGFLAWKGYLQEGRGLLVCDVIDPIFSTINWTTDLIAFEHCFIAQAKTGKYLRTAKRLSARSLELESAVIEGVERAISSYNPQQMIVLLIQGNQELEINLLQNLGISPSDCYHQVQRRWAEFQPSLTPQRRHS
jgi:hypothetical protein